ncbi:MAG: hypothetical protein ACLTCI_06765 [[Clostridium] nexile]
MEFHAGNKANVLEHNIENNDDFTLRNIRMILPNGKTLTPVSYEAKKGLVKWSMTIWIKFQK